VVAIPGIARDSDKAARKTTQPSLQAKRPPGSFQDPVPGLIDLNILKRSGRDCSYCLRDLVRKNPATGQRLRLCSRRKAGPRAGRSIPLPQASQLNARASAFFKSFQSLRQVIGKARYWVPPRPGHNAAPLTGRKSPCRGQMVARCLRLEIILPRDQIAMAAEMIAFVDSSAALAGVAGGETWSFHLSPPRKLSNIIMLGIE